MKGREITFLIAMGSETVLLDYRGPAEICLGIGSGEGQSRRLVVDGWIKMGGGWAGNIFGINFLYEFEVDLYRGELYCFAT